MKRRLDELLVARQLAPSLELARSLVMAGRVYRAEERLEKPGLLLAEDEQISLRSGRRFVSRGGDKLEGALRSFGAHFSDLQGRVGVDIGARKAVFATPEGERSTVSYDYLHVVPPMRAPDAVKNSPLAWQEGPFAAGGWLEVDKETLQHRRYPNVFGLGDINGTPRGKTAATIKKSAPLVARNLIDVIGGGEPSQRFDGYTSCPLLLREGAALLVEFDYEGRLVPSLPMVEPLQDSYFAWLMKYRLLKPAYMAVAKGRV